VTYIGYQTIGGTWTTATPLRHYLKRVTHRARSVQRKGSTVADFTEPKDNIVPLLDQDDNPLPGPDFTVTSSDPAVARVGDTGAGGSAHFGIVGVSAGTATIHVVRHSDGATGTDKTIEVTEVTPGAFEWHFGTATPGTGF
jgi:hypothetical protein